MRLGRFLFVAIIITLITLSFVFDQKALVIHTKGVSVAIGEGSLWITRNNAIGLLILATGGTISIQKEVQSWHRLAPEYFEDEAWIICPLSFIAVGIGFLAMLFEALYLFRTYHRRRNGCCEHCGHILMASTEVCQECGTVRAWRC